MPDSSAITPRHKRNTPVDVFGLTTGVSQISASGQAHTCAVLNTGALKCWGYNNYGQVGDGTTTNRLTPVDVSGLTTGVSSVSAGEGQYTCATLLNGHTGKMLGGLNN